MPHPCCSTSHPPTIAVKASWTLVNRPGGEGDSQTLTRSICLSSGVPGCVQRCYLCPLVKERSGRSGLLQRNEDRGVLCAGWRLQPGVAWVRTGGWKERDRRNVDILRAGAHTPQVQLWLHPGFLYTERGIPEA